MAVKHSSGPIFGVEDKQGARLANIAAGIAVTDAAAVFQAQGSARGLWVPTLAQSGISTDRCVNELLLQSSKLHGTMFVAMEKIRVTRIWTFCKTAGATTVLGRGLLYKLASTNGWRDFTLLARSSNVATLCLTANTGYTFTFASGTGPGGNVYPGFIDLVPGDVYFAGFTWSGTGAPSVSSTGAIPAPLLDGTAFDFLDDMPIRAAIADAPALVEPASGTFATGTIDRIPLVGVAKAP